MVGTSGVNCPVTRLQRAARYLVWMVSMICWMKFSSRSRVSKYICFVKQCVFYALAIWEAVPAGFGTRTPGLGGQVDGSVGAMRRYSAGVSIIPS